MRKLLVPFMTLSLTLGCVAAIAQDKTPPPAQEHQQVTPQQAAPQQPAEPVQAQAASQSWTGTLLDAQCKTADASKTCAITDSTTSFGIVTSNGHFAKFDDAGNTMVTAKRKDPQGVPTKVKVSGKLDGDTLSVESIEPMS